MNGINYSARGVCLSSASLETDSTISDQAGHSLCHEDCPQKVLHTQEKTLFTIW